MKIAILGFGREGKSILKFLQNRGFTRIRTRIYADKKDEIWILDQNPRSNVPRGIKTQLGKNYLKDLNRFDIVFRSPGIPYRLPEIQRAKKAGVKISSATKLFFEALRGQTRTTRRKTQKKVSGGRHPIIIGITGSKGKSTTAALLYKILKASGRKVFLAGNIGIPALELLPRLSASSPHKSAIIVLELSSFQLEDLTVSPHIALALDVFPEHQDSHGSLAEYYRAKANISRHQKTGGAVFYFAKNQISARIGKLGKGKKIPVNLIFSNSREWWNEKNGSNVKGWHTLKNYAMAATVAKYVGVPASTIQRTIKNFPGLPHRLQRIRTIRAHLRSNPRQSALIEFYDDSASHNPHAAIAAISSFPGSIKILIAGGKDRPFDYRMLGKSAKENQVAMAILFGENKNKIARALGSSKAAVRLTRTLREAIHTAYREAKAIAKKNPASQIVVLFSPGAPSYDMFENFEERGREFIKCIQKLK